MIIISNQTTEHGDILYMQTDTPAIGVSALIGFTDNTIGESPNVYYKKSFQISKDGAIWSNWMDLTIANIQSLEVNRYDELYVKYKYQHVGPGILEFNSNLLKGTYETLDCPFYFQQSIFSKYFGCHDLRVLKWYLNVVEKLYTVELNRYMKFDNGVGDPSDAISFWQSIAKYFAFYVVLARVYRDFYLNENLLNSFLQQRGLFTANFNVLTELNQLMKNFSTEIAKRGTRAVYQSKDKTDLANPSGELKRYLNLTDDNEFIFNWFLQQHCGWWIDESSPMYRGLDGHLNANKLPAEKFALSGGAVINELEPNDVRIDFNGLGSLEFDSDIDKLISASQKNNYILEFEIRVTDPATTLSVGAQGYTNLGEQMAEMFSNFKTGVDDSWFIQNVNLSRFSQFPTKWFKISCVIFNIDKPIFADDVINLGIGNNLKFRPTSTANFKIYPVVSVSGTAIIKNIALRPLYTPYERGFVHMNNFVEIDYMDTQQPII